MPSITPAYREALDSGRLQIVSSIQNIAFDDVKVWITDIENTLAPPSTYHLEDWALAVFEGARAAGVQSVVLLTNKPLGSVGGAGDFSPIATQLRGIGFDEVHLFQPAGLIKHPRKPQLAAFRRAFDAISAPTPPHQVLMSGDKWTYDVHTPLSKLGWKAALVNPVAAGDWRDHWGLVRERERLSMWLAGVSRPS